jgi:hypothetical protein
MTVLLKDAPGGAQLIETLAGAARILALLYPNTADAPALRHLASYIAAIEPTLAEELGADLAAKMMAAFHSAVMTEKHRIESGGASRA